MARTFSMAYIARFPICVAIVAFMAVYAAPAQAQIIRGIVVDERNEERLPNANILIRGTTIGATTNVEGVFILRDVPSALCTLEVRYIGYRTQSVPLDASKPIENLVIRMKETTIQLGEVTVTAEPEPTTIKSQKEPSLITISPKQLASLPMVGDVDIFRGLQLLPGVAGTNDASAGLYVRGGTPDQNLVLFDGMTIRHVDHFFGFFSAFSAEAVKDIQFYKGGFPAKYGGVLSSVVDMTGRTGDQREIRASAGLNLITGNANVEVPLWERGSFFLAGRATHGGSELAGSIYRFLTGDQGAGPSGGPGGGPGGGARQFSSDANFQREVPLPSFYDLNAKATYYVTPTDVVSVSMYMSNDQLDRAENLGGPVGMGGGPTGGGNTTDLTNQENFGLSGRLFHQWGADLFTNVVFASSRYTNEYIFQIETIDSNQTTQRNGQNESNSIRDLTLRIDNDWHLHQDHTVAFGLNLVASQTEYKLTIADQFRGVSDLIDIGQRGTQSAFYVQNEWRITSALSSTIGFRASYYQPTRQIFLDPRFSARLALTDNLSVKTATGIYRQFTNRIVNESITRGSRDFWLMTDSDFKPGKSVHYILGGTWEDNDILFDVEAYYKPMSGLVEFSQRIRLNATDPYTFATGTGISQGIEVLLQKKHGMFKGWMSYSLSKTRYSFPVIQEGEQFPAAQDQLHELKLSGSMALQKWNFSANWVYGSGKPFTEPVSQYTLELLDGSQFTYVHVGGKNAQRLPAYHRLDVSGSYIVRRDDGSVFCTLGLSVFNLYNRNNVSYYTYDLDTDPPTVTQVASLGITPTLFAQFNIK